MKQFARFLNYSRYLKIGVVCSGIAGITSSSPLESTNSMSQHNLLSVSSPDSLSESHVPSTNLNVMEKAGIGIMNVLEEKQEKKDLNYGVIINSTSDFDPNQHYYPKILNAELHPLVSSFLSLGINRIAERYCHLNPKIDKKALLKLLKHEPSHLRWSGADLFVTTTEHGNRKLTVIETNTCPSGQKSMPRSDDEINDGYGYKKLIRSTFQPLLSAVSPDLFDAKLAVIYDKNEMEASGYAHAMASIFGEDVYLVPYLNDDEDPPVRFTKDGIMYIRIQNENENENEDEWIPIRASFRYVTQNPWDRIPVNTKTLILNPIIACLSGGRNKNLAAKAYEIFNTSLQTKRGLSGLQLNTPETVKDVSFDAIPFIIKKFGGVGVIKSPYGNAGVDVFTITNDLELDEFMNNFGKQTDNHFSFGRGYGQKFIVQSLIGNSNWSSETIAGKYYHVGTVPDRRGNIYAADIRMMIHWNGNSWSPLCVYSRRAKEPLSKDLNTGVSSWDILGTNLSVKLGENDWKSDTNRLLVMDTRSFSKLGIGLDDLINGYIQSVLATIAIDDLCKVFMQNDDDQDKNNQFDFELFATLNPDKDIINDIKRCNNPTPSNQ